jgi:carboxylesterase type B
VRPQLLNLDGFNLGTTQMGYAQKRSGRPVMVWIYAGGLIAVEANDYNASKLVTQSDVLLPAFLSLAS